jgi:hypothetical protein
MIHRQRGRTEGKDSGDCLPVSALEDLQAEYLAFFARGQPTYALPPALIESVEKECPDLLHVGFEREFSKLGCGVAGDRVLTYLNDESFPDRRFCPIWQDMADNIAALVEEEQVDLHGEESATIRSWQRAYAAWLVMNADYRREVSSFRNEWGGEIEALGQFPHRPITMVGEEPHPNLFGELGVGARRALWELYDRWQLDRLETWDLPVPMRADLAQPSLYPIKPFNSHSLVVAIPYYMLKAPSAVVSAMIGHKIAQSHQPHLMSWYVPNEKKFGLERLARLLELFIYLELAIRPRYGGRMNGKVDALDDAFGQYFSPDMDGQASGAESVRKLRQYMQRELGKVASAKAKGTK